MPSRTCGLSALFLPCSSVCPNFCFCSCSAKEIGGSNAGAALPAKQKGLLAVPILGRCAGACAGAAWRAAGDAVAVAGEHLCLNLNFLLVARL